MKCINLTLLNFIFILSSFSLTAQIVETITSHPTIRDGLYVDKTGHIYTTSGGLTGDNTIGKYDINLKTFNSNFASGFAGPVCIEQYRDSLLIITNYDNNTVSSYHLNTGQILEIANGLDGPAGIAIDGNENIYISNWGGSPNWAGHTINKIDPQGNVSLYIDDNLLLNPQGMTVNHHDELIVHSQGKLYKVNPIDSSLNLWSDVGFTVGNMCFNTSDSSVYAPGGNKIIRIDHLGNTSIYAGMESGYVDGSIDIARFFSPLGIALSPTNDTLYIAEAGYNTSTGRLRSINPDELSFVDYTVVDNLMIYPNPFTNEFMVQINTEIDIPIAIHISDLSGSVIYSNDNYSTNTPIKIADQLATGMYILHLKHGAESEVVKIIKN